MLRSSVPTRLVLALSLCLGFSAASTVRADDVADLKRAIALFDSGEYLAAQEMLVNIDRAKLPADQQAVRDDYLSRAQVAVRMFEKAVRDLEDAETAMDSGEKDDARRLLESVLANDYAAPPVKQSASAMLRDLGPETPRTAVIELQMQPAEQPAPAAPTSRPMQHVVQVVPSTDDDAVTRARSLCAQAAERARAADYENARRLYHEALAISPGLPEAVDGLQRIADHERNVSTEGDSLIERIRREDAINWQRTVAEYREVESNIRANVTAERFDEAQQLMVRARQIVESGRQFADPAAKYEALRAEADALSEMVSNAERDYNTRRVAEIRRQIEQERTARAQEDAENRKRQVDALMKQAHQHRKDGDLESAITVLKQVTVIDPKYREARWMLDELDDLQQYRRGRDARDDLYREQQAVLNDVEVSKVPWHVELSYPDNWPELVNRPERSKPGATPIERRLLSALDRKVPVNFRGDPLDQVIERLADSQRLNIIVNWRDLELAGVTRKTPIDLRLPQEISLQMALTEVLEQAGGAVELGYDLNQSGLKIATKATLAKETVTAVYDIQDLLMEIPNFSESPMTDLAQANDRTMPTRADREARPWAVGDDDDDDKEKDPERQARVRKIVDIIQESIAPDSWIERGGSVGTIKEINGQLVITQNSATQRQIADLLGKLREQRAVQIAVEARFITVSSHYLEEIGVDIDITLNAGNAGFDYLPTGSGPLTDPVLGNPLLLPRTFSRIGATPNTPAIGTPLPGVGAVQQPWGRPYLVPQRGGSGNNMTPVPIQSNILSLTNPANLGSDVPGSFAGQTIAPAFSMFGSFLDNIQVDFLIRATQADSRTTVLTAPRLVLFNGQRSWVAVTIQQAFVSQLNPVVATGAVAQAPQTGVIDSGAVLDVSATVTADKRYVTMTVRPGVTRLLDLQTIPFSGGAAGGGFVGGGAGTAFIQLPTLSSQRVQTTVSVPDGGTLLIGGQKLASESEIEAGVPGLSKIPILKRAYSSRSMVKDEQTLLILIKPKIFIQTEQEELAFPGFQQRG